MTIDNILKYHINRTLTTFVKNIKKPSTGGITISCKDKEHGIKETIIAYIKTEDFSDLTEHHLIAGRIIKFFIVTRNSNKTEVYVWIENSYRANAKIVRKISKPLHSAYNPLFNGDNPVHYKPVNVMKKLYKLIYFWKLNNRKKRFGMAKLLVCIFIDLRFPMVLNEEVIDYITKDRRIKKLHKILESKNNQNMKGRKIMKTLKLPYLEIENYFQKNLIFTDYCWDLWDLIPEELEG